MKIINDVFVLSICLMTPAIAAPPLPAYGIDLHQTSVSGVSSGGAMAVQMHVAHSSIMLGIGVIAGVTYDCANSALPSVHSRLAQGLLCMDGSIDYSIVSLARTHSAAANGYIDSTTNLARQKIWLFSGYNDGSVRRGAMNAMRKYYGHFVNSGNVNSGNLFYQTDNHAPHAIVTNGYGGACLSFDTEYINDCQYDAARNLLEHIYGSLNPPDGNSPSGITLEFDQREFVANLSAEAIGLADTGYAYVPTACQSQACRVHVVFHGCKQYAGRIGRAVVDHAGYNKWADTNRLIILYPQTAPTASTPINPGNPFGCWDWWGFSDLPRNSEFARKSGYQISAIRAMLERLTENFVQVAGSSSTFGPPKNFTALDSTSNSVALSWQPNSAAVGFNIYRARTSTGKYRKRNSAPVTGASFADQGLDPATTYHYKIRAVDASNQESAPTGPISKATVSKAPACQPYFSDNETHVAQGRAFVLGTTTYALGTNNFMGPFDKDTYRQLTKEGPLLRYRVGYCP